jgi:hypothetical protein
MNEIDQDIQLAARTDEPPRPRHGLRRWMPWIKLALLLLVFFLVGRSLLKQWRVIDWSQVHLRPIPLALSMLALVGVSTVQMISYRTLLGAYAHAPKWRQMLAVAWVPPLGKYVPGKVAALLAAMSMLRRFAIPAAVAVSVVLVLDGLAVVAGLITGSPLLLWQPIRDVAPWAWIICVPVTIAGIVCLYPGIFARLINFLLRKLKKQPLPRMPALREYLVPVLCAFAQWVFAGLSLMWTAEAVTGESSLQHLPVLISLAALGQTIGYLALFAPGGIGPRDGIFFAALRVLYDPITASLIVPIRLVAQIVIDLVLAMIGLAILRRSDQASTLPD